MLNLAKLCLALAMLTVTACGPADTQSTSGGVPSPSINVSFAEPAAIDITAVHPLPLTGVELIAPDGRTSRAATIDREFSTAAPSYPPSVGVGIFGGSGGIGLGTGLGFPLGGGYPASAPPPVRAKARVTVGDVTDYRQNWERYVVRLRFGTAPADTAVADMPAPAPR
jgi:hypothetical protein